MYARILVPLDGTAVAERILPHAFALAKCFDATLVLLHAINARSEMVQANASPEPATSVPIAPDVVDAAVQAEATASDSYLSGVQQRASAEGVRCEAAIVEGYASDIVIRATTDYKIDLVAMTTPGRSSLGRLFFGSTAEAVLQEINVPALVLHAEEKG
jgi:nucleotide-binding universal stress UspA family protein